MAYSAVVAAAPSPRAAAPWFRASRRSSAAGSSPRQRRELKRDVRQRLLPAPVLHALGLGLQPCRRGQLARQDVIAGEVVEQELQDAQRPGRARELGLPGGELEPGLVVPQIHRRDVVRQGERVELPGLVAMCSQSLLQRRSRGRVAVREAGREPDEQELPGRQGLGAERCGAGRARNVDDVLADSETARVERRHQRFEVGLARELVVDRLEPLRGPQQQRRRVAAASHLEGDLGTQALHLGLGELVERARHPPPRAAPAPSRRCPPRTSPARPPARAPLVRQDRA